MNADFISHYWEFYRRRARRSRGNFTGAMSQDYVRHRATMMRYFPSDSNKPKSSFIDLTGKQRGVQGWLLGSNFSDTICVLCNYRLS